jgi:serine/threonine-protein kinase ATR
LSAHFRFAKYLDSILESRILVLTGDNIRISDDEAMRSAAIQKDQSSQKYFLEALKEYGEALRLGLKHVFQALPRFLTLWFEFTGIPVTEKSPEGFSTNQDAANEIVAKYIRSIPSVAYYSVLPQLISRVGHTDEDTVTVVSAILKR